MSLTPAAAETLRNALATVVVVPVTPLLADGNPDWTAYARLTRRLIDGGITVITPNGNTGEFYALRDLAMLELFYSTGTRLSELAGLNLDRLDLLSDQGELLSPLAHRLHSLTALRWASSQ